jgi:PAS domain S-box-containing protein
MRGITEEQEAANEELQSSNEELLSGSEELQSLNEELETSKEELQSTNEELITVNQELYDSNDELNKSRRFAEASISILHEPLLVLDKKFIIKSANLAFYKIFKLTEDETLGHVLFELQNNGWDIPGLRKELEKIQREKEKLIEVEIAFTFPVIGERIIGFNIQPLNREVSEQLILLALDDVTLRKNATQILAEKASGVLKERQVLNNFFLQTPAILCILKGPEHVFEFANPLYQQYTGNRAIIGQKLFDALPELLGQGFLALLDEVYLTGVPFIGKKMPLTLENIEGKAEQHFVDLNYQAFKNEAGIIEGILVFAYDVTEQVIARRQLEQNAEMIHNLYMNAPGFICTLMGPEHTYTLVNPSYQKLFGTREIVGKPIMIALPELEGQGFDKILDHVYETGETYVGIEIPITLAFDEGLVPEERYFNFSYQPIYQEDKRINGILVFGYEVTEEIRGRKIQEESAERFRILAEAMPQKVWTADAKGNINYFNEKWFEYTHKSFEELKDWGWKKIIHPDDWEINRESWQLSIDTGEGFQLEHRFLCHDGTYRWHLSRGVAQKDESGKLITWLGTNTDIHKQKLFEKELEKQIAARIEIERQKNDFISMASHELKTPVTSLKGYTQSLQRKFKNEGNTEAEPFLLKMDKQINKLTVLINDLLDSTKVTGRQLKFNEELFEFNELIKEIVEEMQLTSKRHSITINLDASEMIFGDRNRIGQVVTNMLSNAIKYSPKTDNIIVTTGHENNHIKFCVQDFGIGIPPEKQSKVFDQFFRVSGDLQETFSGLGLGLFIASEIIRRHKGIMSVDSIEGEGSTFYFTLPIPNVSAF